MKGRARPREPLADVCEFQTPACRGPVTVRHHRKGRGRPELDTAEFTADICNPCHLYVHAHPDESYTEGWMLHRNGPPRAIP